MAKKMPVPPELEFLLEKRDAEKDRRKLERRGGARGKGTAASGERRAAADRRRKKRRKSDR